MKTFKKLLCLLLAGTMLFSCGSFAFAAENETEGGGIIIDEDASENLILYGNANKKEEDGGYIELTPLERWCSGSVWYAKQIAAVAGFNVTVEYWAGGGREDSYGGADGIVLTFAEETGIGANGGQLGFVDGSWGIELDSYYGNENDPSGKHIAIINGNATNHICQAYEDRVDDSQWHTLKVNYVPGKMDIYIDEELVLSEDGVYLPDKVYLGISAATGAGLNAHYIRNFIMGGIVSEGEEILDDTDPIIVVPGIMGSRLFKKDGDYSKASRVWDPPKDTAGDLWNIGKLNEHMEYSNTLYVRPCENQNATDEGTVAVYGREYGAIDTYKKLVNSLCETFPEREIYVFSYDWRKSSATNADKLDEFLDELEAEKVDFVCHSMGGLVVSDYYNRYGSQKIDKIITCGTPYEGSPKLINSVQNLDVLGDGVIFGENDFNDLFLGAWGGMRKDLKSSFYGVAELTPTKNYCKTVPMWEDSAWPFSLGDNKLTYDQYVNTCEEIFGTKNYTSAKKFQKSLHGSDGYNALLGYDKSYFVIGINQPTISAVKFQWAGNDIDDLMYENKGDGTVPYLSATMMKKVEELDSTRYLKKAVDHTNVVKNGDCIDWIEDILRFGVSRGESEDISNRPYTVIRVACPVDVTVSCGDEIISSDKNNLGMDSTFGRLDVIGENDEVKMIFLYTDEDYSIEVNGTGEGTMDYAIRFFDENGEKTDERIFEDIAITEETVIKTTADPGEKTVISVDTDGDGNIDETWSANENTWITTDDEKRVPLENIAFANENIRIGIGRTKELEMTLMPLDTTDKAFFSYSSSDESIAKVDSDGKVIGLSKGKATITAVASNGMQVETVVTVVAFGNIDGNDNVNILDANLIRRYAARLAELDSEQFFIADVDGNGKVNALDANLIRRYAAKMINKFPVEG